MAEYIEREAFEYSILHEDVEIAEHKCKDYESYINGANQFRYQMKNALRKAPAADVVEVRHGRWIEIDYTICCSECGRSWRMIDNDTWSFYYCPHCGAKMDGKGER